MSAIGISRTTARHGSDYTRNILACKGATPRVPLPRTASFSVFSHMHSVNLMQQLSLPSSCVMTHHRFSTLGAEAHYPEASGTDLGRQVVHGNVGRRADENLHADERDERGQW